jgi:hypothetical protein
MRKPNTFQLPLIISLLLLTTLSCRPVITVGWQEIGILAIIILVIMGPALFRLYKRFDEFQNWKGKKDKTED